VGYTFEWDTGKAQSNARKHGVTFEEASTVFEDPLALLMADPDHSEEEERCILLGTRAAAGFWWWPSRRGHRAPA